MTLSSCSTDIQREVVLLEPCNLIAWLEAQTLYPKVYWKDRDGDSEVAAVGALCSFSEVPEFPDDASPLLRFYGGMDFSADPRKENSWRTFPSCYFFLPQLEIIQKKSHTELIINSLDSSMPALHPEKILSSFSKSALQARSDQPSLETWKKQIHECLNLFENNLMQKVVLARRSTFSFSENIQPFKFLQELLHTVQRATFFAFQLSQEQVFLGASPEKLYERTGDCLFSEAMAGTRPRGKNPQEDHNFYEDLLSSNKDYREFAFVKDFINTTLMPLCVSQAWEPKDRVVTTSTVQHLYNRLTAQLISNVKDKHLIEKLHPSPAMGGNPRGKALQYIAAHEHFDRGWYASPVGWISPQAASFAVGIRSALIDNHQIHLFSGCGIVPGSTPEKEWEELELKISQMKRILL